MIVLRPTDLAGALLLLAQEPGAVPWAGGTDLMVALKNGTVPTVAVDLWRIDSLRGIRFAGDRLVLGPLTTHAELAGSEIVQRYAPALAQSAAQVGSPQIRNRGTVGGNLVHASPAADTVGPLFTHDAELVLASTRGSRIVPVAKFALGPGRTVREPDELLTEIRLVPAQTGDIGFFRKLGQRKALACAKVSVAVRAGVTQGRFAFVRIALGAVAPTVIRAEEAEAALTGKPVGEDTVWSAEELVQSAARPIDDLRSDAEYRRRMTGVLFRRGLLAALAAGEGWTPPRGTTGP